MPESGAKKRRTEVRLRGDLRERVANRESEFEHDAQPAVIMMVILRPISVHNIRSARGVVMPICVAMTVTVVVVLVMAVFPATIVSAIATFPAVTVMTTIAVVPALIMALSA